MGSCRNRQLQLDSPTRQQVGSNGKSQLNSPVGDWAYLKRDKRVNSPVIKDGKLLLGLVFLNGKLEIL